MLLDIDKKDSKAVAAIDSSGAELRYGDLVHFIGSMPQLLPRRSLVFLLVENNVGGIAWTMGMLGAGVVPLILNARLDHELFTQLNERYKPAYLCVPKEQKEKYDYGEIASEYGYVILKTGEKTGALHDSLSHLLPTSGSTGSPKLVRHCYRNIEAAGLNISTFFEIKAEDKALMVLPIYYTMGLSMIFSHLYAGATILITGLNMTDPAFWSFMKDKKASSFTGVPYSFEVLNLMRFFRMSFPDLRLLTQGGGRMERKLNLKFAEYCHDHGMKWIATYGQTEGSARMAYLPPEYAISKVGSIGQAVPNGELSLIDDAGKLIEEPYKEGEMCYRGKNVTMGYAQTKEDLLLGDERNGWMRTGDIAYRDEDGFYFIVGRMGRFLKLFGMRIGLDECEQIVKSKFSTECACFGTDEKMIVCITESNILQAVKEELVEKTRLVASAFEIKVVDSLPKNEAGKILYSKLKNQIESL